jgi:hypothetical protein
MRRVFLIFTMIQEEGLDVYKNIHNIVGKHFSISIATVRNRGESLVLIIITHNIDNKKNSVQVGKFIS